MEIFKQQYSGESIVDVCRDVWEAFDADFNPLVENIPQDEYGIQKGTFTVTVTWEPEE